jgi:translation initiation factor 6
LAIYLSDVVGSSYIGVYSLATDKMVIVPSFAILKKAEKMAEWLRVKLVHTSVGGSVLVGALASANSNGILLPSFVREAEIEAIRKGFEGNVTVMETRRTAYGNLVLANDRGAIVDPRLKTPDIDAIAETLGVEVVPSEIAGLPYVGSLAVATNKGVIAHPLLKDDERKVLESVLKVPVDVGSVNCGIPFVGTGLIGNRYAAVAGSMTTGPEMFIIEHALDVVQEEVEHESIQSNR